MVWVRTDGPDAAIGRAWYGPANCQAGGLLRPSVPVPVPAWLGRPAASPDRLRRASRGPTPSLLVPPPQDPTPKQVTSDQSACVMHDLQRPRAFNGLVISSSHGRTQMSYYTSPICVSRVTARH